MEQRPPRLGDLVDDYCPRERRITNHAIVAIVDDTIRQTRCSACDVEHDYKEARVPKKPLKKPLAINGASSDLAGGVLVSPAAARAAAADPAPADAPIPAPAAGEGPAGADAPAEEERAVDGWLAHRPLIRASLPRQENAEPPPRPIPEFTMHQRPAARAFHGRGFRPHSNGTPFRETNPFREGNGEPNGNRPSQPGAKPGAGGARRRRRRRR